MNIYHSIQEYQSGRGSVVTLGTFDGVHKGHQSILKKVVNAAKKLQAESIVLSFFPHPRMVLQKNTNLKLLNTLEEKTELFEQFGIQHFIVHEFNQTFANLTAEQFVKNILVDTFNIKKIIIGYDHRFGKNRSADINDLTIYGKKYGFEVEQISVQEVENISVSSTKIRNAIIEGNISLANQYLGHHYSFSGMVIHGKKIGRTIGFPTANIQVKAPYKLLPANGVYLVQSVINNQMIKGIMNIGTKPTIGGTTQSIEVHYLGFNENIYNQVITVELIEKIRNEKKFDNLEELKQAIEQDKIYAINYLTNEE